MANVEIKIERGVPMPPRQSRNNGVTAVIRSMKVGESFVHPATDDPMKLRNRVYQLARQIGVKVSCRPHDNTIRVWRIE